ncbi:MAG: DNA-processing protein DprA [Spirochaetia bacterium]
MEINPMYIGVGLLSGLSCSERIILFDSVGSENDLFRLSKSGVENIAGKRLRGSVIPHEWEREAHRIAQLIARGDFKIVHYWDRMYPPQLREIHDPPFLLYVRGELPEGGVPAVAVVGTRRPTETAVHASFLLGAELSLSGIPVVSGLAKGVDAAAHWGAVKTGGCTAAVEATGIDRVYPSAHRDLAGRILGNGGCLVSEYPPGTEVRRYRFPERNRLISGLVRSVVVVQAPSKSGALITADYAIEEGRDLLVHRSGLTGTVGAGGRRLAEEGARVIEEASEIADEWETDGPCPGYTENDGEAGVDGETGVDGNSGEPRIKRTLRPVRFPSDSTLEALEDELEGRIIRYCGRKYRRVG